MANHRRPAQSHEPSQQSSLLPQEGREPPPKRGLCPAYGDLEAAIDDLMESVRDTTDVSTSFQLDMWQPLRGRSRNRHVLAIIRGAVDHALEDSACTHISVSLKQNGRQRDVSIADNGSGGRPADGARKHADRLNASIAHERRKSGGTVVRLTFEDRD